MEKQIKDNTINKKCSRCGECCGIFIPITDEEIKIIKNYVKQKNIVPEDRVNDNNVELRCPFFNVKEYKCNIYEVRPFVCRDFICSRKNWKEKRKEYMNRSKYNSFTMDELIYDDVTIFVMILLNLSEWDTKNFFKIAELLGRKDILERIDIECKKEGDILKIKSKKRG